MDKSATEVGSLAVITGVLSALGVYLVKEQISLSTSTIDLCLYLIPILSSGLASFILWVFKLLEISPETLRTQRQIDSQIKLTRSYIKENECPQRVQELKERLHKLEDSRINIVQVISEV